MVGKQGGQGMIFSPTSASWMGSLVAAPSNPCLPCVCWLQTNSQKPEDGIRRTRWTFVLRPLRKSVWIYSVFATLDARPHRVPEARLGVSSAAGDALKLACDEGHLDRALEVLLSMDQQGIVPSANVYRSILKLCARKRALAEAEQVHVHLTKNGLEFTGFLGESVVITLVKCGALENALQVFHRLKQRTVFAWTAVISGSAMSEQGREALRLYRCMQQEGVQPNTYTFVSLFKACGSIPDLEEGKLMHSEAIKHRCDSDLFVRTCLVDMYGKCGSIVDARNVFDELAQRDVVAWTAMLGAYVQHGQAGKAWELYEEMVEEGMRLDVPIFVSVLQACGLLAEQEEDVDSGGMKFKSLGKSRAIHAEAWGRGYDSESFVGSSLISVYGKCGSIVDAQNVFDVLSRPNVVSWTAMLTIYTQEGHAQKTLHLYEQMQKEGVNPDTCTFVSALLACGLLAEEEEDSLIDGQVIKVKSLEKGKAVHAAAKRQGEDSDVFVANSLVGMYAKCGSILDAQTVFDGLSHRDVVSWNAMLGAYSQNGQGAKAVQLYRQMLKEGVIANEITLVCILRTCGNAGGLDACRLIYSNHVSSGKDLKPAVVASTLIHVFSRCASMVDAQAVFDALSQPDVVSWTALIAGYARVGNSAASLQRYEEGRLVGMEPNSVTFVALLSACSHAGLVDKGVEYFESMTGAHGIPPAIEHYVCMVDLLGRAGCFESVQHLLSTMPVLPTLALWLCLLGACRKHGKVVLGRHAFHCSLQIQPKHPAAYVLMFNIYADAGLWECASEVKELRQNAGAWKKPGKSWIEHEHELHTFVVEDHKHPQMEQLYYLSEKVSSKSGDHGTSKQSNTINCV